MRISLISLNARYIHANPAPYYIRQELAARLPGAEIRLHQLTINDPYYDTLLRITDDEPTAVFFSVYVWNAAYVGKLAADLALVLPKTRIVMGGPEAAALGGHHVGTVVRGEIERVERRFFADLAADRLAGEYGPGPAAGLPPTPYLDSDFQDTLRNRQLYYEASRGCPFSCAYCLSAAEHDLRLRELDEVKADLARLLSHRPRIIRFVDRTFNLNPDRALAIWRFLAARPEKTVFHFEIAPDLFTEEMFVFLATVPAGRFQFEIGLQSTDPAVLRAVNRPMDVKRALTAIRRLAAAGNIHLHVDLILGLPEETATSFKKSFNDAFACRAHYLQMGLLKVLPGTPLSRQAATYGLVHAAAPPYGVLATRWLDHAALKHLYRFGACVESFCNNRFFSTVIAYLRKTEPDPFDFFAELLSICREAGFFELAATQELMNRLLMKLSEPRPDRALFTELLRYDWLRSGHRFLPAVLEEIPLQTVRNHLWKRLPPNYPPLFDHAGRDEFFKQTAFLACSGDLLRETGLAGGETPGFICLLPEEADGVLDLKKAVFIPAGDGLPPLIRPA